MFYSWTFWARTRWNEDICCVASDSAKMNCCTVAGIWHFTGTNLRFRLLYWCNCRCEDFSLCKRSLLKPRWIYQVKASSLIEYVLLQQMICTALCGLCFLQTFFVLLVEQNRDTASGVPVRNLKLKAVHLRAKFLVLWFAHLTRDSCFIWRLLRI